VASTKMMIERTEQRHDLKPDWLTADTAYGEEHPDHQLGIDREAVA
jgi:hypothetical protein